MKNTSNLLFGAIEAGGTKFVCAIGDGHGTITKSVTIPTTMPDELMPKVIKFFQDAHQESALSAIGIATFGPIDPDPKSLTYGYITTPPKPGWGNYNIRGAVYEALKLPIGFDTDVNGAALGEQRFGAAKGLDTFIYVTVGTGIGAGGMVGGKMMHGLIHPEMGHMFVPHDHSQDNFAGVCPFHGNCLEGLATGPAMQKRWNVKEATDLPPNHEGWNLEADYLAAAFANCVLVLSPQKIIVGGGVMKNKSLYPKIRERIPKLLNGYIKHEKILKDMDNYIVEPAFEGRSGILGGLALAEEEYLSFSSRNSKS